MALVKIIEEFHPANVQMDPDRAPMVSQPTFIRINPDRLATLSLCRAANAVEQAAADPTTWFFIILDLNRAVTAALVAALSAYDFTEAYDAKFRVRLEAFLKNDAQEPGPRISNSPSPPPRRQLVSGVFSIAALFLATGAAHAYDTELPDQMFGAWCQTNNLALDRALPNNEFYSKCENGYLFIFDKGLKYKAGGSCEFASIKFDRREDAYDVFVVRANCKGIVDAKGNPYLYSEIFEIATSEGQLSRRVLPKDSARSGKGRKSVMFMRSVPDSAWWTDCRHGSISKAFAEIDEDNPPVEVSGTTVTITYDELRKLLKDIPRITRALKACDVYRKCLDDRDAGKVKHCLANDRRWREFFTGAW